MILYYLNIEDREYYQQIKNVGTVDIMPIFDDWDENQQLDMLKKTIQSDIFYIVALTPNVCRKVKLLIKMRGYNIDK